MRRLVALTILGLVIWPSAVGAQGEVLKSDNVHFLGKAPATTWVHRATFHNDLVFAGYAGDSASGFETYRVGPRGKPLKRIATFPCKMIGEGTISHWKHFVFQALETPMQGECGKEPAGIRVVDVSDPRNPHKVGFIELECGSHGITTFPYKGKLLIYNTNGCNAETATIGSTGQGGHLNTALRIEVIEFNPRAPGRSSMSKPIIDGVKGCHDLTVYKPRDLAVCTGTGRWAVLDISDPFNPATISSVDDRNLGPGSAQFTWDGQHVLLNKIPVKSIGEYDSCFHWLPHRAETHGLNVWNIEDPTNPVRVGRYLLNRTPPLWEPGEYDYRCHAANFTVVPMNDPQRYVAVTSWGNGGMSVIDFSDPARIKELAYYQPQDSNTMWWTAWYNGRVYVTENSGFEDRGVPAPDPSNPPDPNAPPVSPPAWIHAMEIDGLGPRDTRYYTHGLVTQWQDPADLGR